MGSKLATGYVELKADVDGLQRELDEVKRRVEKSAKSTEQRLNDSTGKMSTAWGKTRTSVLAVGKAVTSLGGIIAGAGIGLLAKNFLDANSAMEGYGVRLKVLLGTQKEGNALFASMRDLAGKLPFEFNQVMASATQLAGVMKGGVSEVEDWMPLIADLAAATGLGVQEATEQVIRMYSAGAASADLFRERGVLAALGFEAGVSYSAEETRKKLIEEWSKAGSFFKGATDEMAETWEGKVSMMKDARFNFAAEIGKLMAGEGGGALAGITSGMTKLYKAMQDFNNNVKWEEMGENWAKAFPKEKAQGGIRWFGVEIEWMKTAARKAWEFSKKYQEAKMAAMGFPKDMTEIHRYWGEALESAKKYDEGLMDASSEASKQLIEDLEHYNEVAAREIFPDVYDAFATVQDDMVAKARWRVEMDQEYAVWLADSNIQEYYREQEGFFYVSDEMYKKTQEKVDAIIAEEKRLKEEAAKEWWDAFAIYAEVNEEEQQKIDELWREQDVYYDKLEERSKKSYKEQAKESDSFFEGLRLGYDDLMDKQETWGEHGFDVMQTFSKNAKKAFRQNLTSVLKGDFDDLGDAWKDLWNSMLDIVIDRVAEMAVEAAVSTSIDWVTTLWAAEGVWKVEDPNNKGVPAIVHEGEMIVPKDIAEEMRGRVVGEGLGSHFDALGDTLGKADPAIMRAFEKGYLGRHGKIAAVGAYNLAKGNIDISDFLQGVVSPQAVVYSALTGGLPSAVGKALAIDQSTTKAGFGLGTMAATFLGGITGPIAAMIGLAGIPGLEALMDVANLRNMEQYRDRLEDVFGWVQGHKAFEMYKRSQVIEDFFAVKPGHPMDYISWEALEDFYTTQRKTPLIVKEPTQGYQLGVGYGFDPTNPDDVGAMEDYFGGGYDTGSGGGESGGGESGGGGHEGYGGFGSDPTGGGFGMGPGGGGGFFKEGTPYVPSTGFAYMHEGERVFSKSDNKKLIDAINMAVDKGENDCPIHVTINVDGQEIGNVVAHQFRSNTELVEATRRVVM